MNDLTSAREIVAYSTWVRWVIFVVSTNVMQFNEFEYHFACRRIITQVLCSEKYNQQTSALKDDFFRHFADFKYVGDQFNLPSYQFHLMLKQCRINWSRSRHYLVGEFSMYESLTRNQKHRPNTGQKVILLCNTSPECQCSSSFYFFLQFCCVINYSRL